MKANDVSFEVGEVIRTLSVDEVMDRYGIHQGFNSGDYIICKVIKKEYLQGNWMIQVKEDGNVISNVWLNQYIFEPYLPVFRENRLKKLLEK